MITLPDGLRLENTPYSTEMEVQDLLVMLVRVLRPKLIVETGAHYGQTTELLGRAAYTVGGGSRVVSCEPDQVCLGEARKRCSGLPVTIYGRKSSDVLEVHYADFLFLDGDYASHIGDFQRAKRGALVVVNFTHTSPYPDIKPLTQFIRSVGGTVLSTHRGLGIIVRP